MLMKWKCQVIKTLYTYSFKQFSFFFKFTTKSWQLSSLASHEYLLYRTRYFISEGRDCDPFFTCHTQFSSQERSKYVILNSFWWSWYDPSWNWCLYFPVAADLSIELITFRELYEHYKCFLLSILSNMPLWIK